ncbi:MAG: hypothetical protein ABW022_10145 [Actinoplanes sp.]
MPWIAAEPDQPVVAEPPSNLTGSEVTMTGLRLEGIVDLPTSNGTLTVLKFSMDQAIINDLLLRASGPVGRTTRIAADRLIVGGEVVLYATRFVAWLLGTKVTLMPTMPMPEGIPRASSIPITFSNPAIDLAFLEGDTVTARPRLTLNLN